MSQQTRQELDHRLQVHLALHTEDSEDYWTFRGQVARGHMHGFYQYPGMMLPQMQGKLIDAVVRTIPETRSVYDPFAGAGTIMTEAMLRGLDFAGQDINPLAVLLCRAKSGPYREEHARQGRDRILRVISSDGSRSIEADFPGLWKWFQEDVAIELSRIRRAIRTEPDLWCRRFYWVALAETVRLTSNSRTSTFKLHIRPERDIRTRTPSPIQTFKTLVCQNLEDLSTFVRLLDSRGLLHNGCYKAAIRISHGDASQSAVGCCNAQAHDLLITSPPYGDNKSTVTYGQHSYLPLQWIDLADIDEDLDHRWLATTNEIDTRSLGGRRANALRDTEELRGISDAFARVLKALECEPADRAQRVAAFVRDLDRCLDPILGVLKPGAYMVWTVGNRRVANRKVPTDQILQELLCARGATPVARLVRRIPSKRMAMKNSIATTMRAETVLVMRKGDG